MMVASGYHPPCQPCLWGVCVLSPHLPLQPHSISGEVASTSRQQEHSHWTKACLCVYNVYRWFYVRPLT